MKYLKYIIIIVLLIIFSAQFIFAQNGSISGIVKGSAKLPDVNISIEQLNISLVSDQNGKYIFNNVPAGKYLIVFSHIGYKKIRRNITLDENQNYMLDVLLVKRNLNIGEAKVVASRSDKKIKDVPLPIEYVGKTKLNNSTQLTLSDLLNRETGLSISKDSPWGTTVSIRGLSKQNVVYLIDGNRIETSTNISAGLSLLDMNDIESVEVVKGGLSSLYGTGATGGVINISSKEASFSDHAYVSSQIIGGFNSVNNGYSNYLNVKTGSTNWSLKLNGSYRIAGDTQIPNGTLSNSSFQDESINAAVKIIPAENMLISFKYQKFSAYDVGIPGGAPFPKSAIAKYKSANRELLSGSIQLNNISDVLLKANVKYYNQVIGREVEINPNPLVTSNPQADHTTNGLAVQTDWYLSSNNYLVSGIDIWQREYEGMRKVTNNVKNIILVDKPVPNSKFGSLGIFIKDEMNLLNNSLNISLSGRYDFIKITNEETKNPVYMIKDGIRNDNVRNDLASFESSNENNKSVSGGFGAVYKITNNLDAVLNLGYNFRSPSLEERFQFIDLGGIVYYGNPKLKPEEGLFFDFGIRVWEDDLNIRFNTFLNSFNNLVIDDVLHVDSVYIKKNVGEARLYGFDGRIDYSVYNNYLIYSSIAFVRGEDLTQNSNLPQISPLNGTLGIVIPIANILIADLSASIASDQKYIGLGEKRTGGFTYFDLNLSSEPIQFGFVNLKVIAGVQNLFDREYREHLSTYRGLNMVEPGRNIFAKFIFEFN
jgi:hemoglobin/transferrin/lactoferrin receptor protein